MDLDRSEQSPHIRTLFHPWQPGDGYDEAAIEAAEARLGVRLPATLRNFYLAWLKKNWYKVTFRPLISGLVPDPDSHPWVHLYVRDGQAVSCVAGYAMAARDAEALEEISQRFQITWARRW